MKNNTFQPIMAVRYINGNFLEVLILSYLSVSPFLHPNWKITNYVPVALQFDKVASRSFRLVILQNSQRLKTIQIVHEE